MPVRYGYKCHYNWWGIRRTVLVASIAAVRTGFRINEHFEYDKEGCYWIPPSQILMVEDVTLEKLENENVNKQIS